jgi:hypothetical protein
VQIQQPRNYEHIAAKKLFRCMGRKVDFTAVSELLGMGHLSGFMHNNSVKSSTGRRNMTGPPRP